MSGSRKQLWPDGATRKANRWSTQRPRRGRWWCYRCDHCLVHENQRCGHCGIRVQRATVKPGRWLG